MDLTLLACAATLAAPAITNIFISRTDPTA